LLQDLEKEEEPASLLKSCQLFFSCCPHKKEAENTK